MDQTLELSLVHSATYKAELDPALMEPTPHGKRSNLGSKINGMNSEMGECVAFAKLMMGKT